MKKVVRMVARPSIKNCKKGKGCATTKDELMITKIKIAA